MSLDQAKLDHIPDEPPMQRCIKVIDLFGAKIVSIESDFVEGFADKRATLTFEKMRAEVQLKDGMPQGIYRVERDGIYGFGHLRSAVVKGACWIVLPDHVSWSLLGVLDGRQCDQMC